MEILVAIKDQGAGIDNIKKGEVITVQPDGWGWSPAELNNPDWRIIKAPILITHAATLMAPYIKSTLMVPHVKYPRKSYLLNTTLLPLLSVGGLNIVPNTTVVTASIKVP